MALSSSVVWEVRGTGSDSNGGGFRAGAAGTDYSQQDAPQLTVPDAAAAGTANLNSAVGGFTAAMVGNVVQIAGGGLAAGFYEVAAYVDANNVTLDRSPGSGGGSTATVGGALASPGKAASGHVSGNTIYVRSGTYTISSAATNVANGCVSLVAGTNASATRLVGYGSARGDDGPRPILSAAGIGAFTVVSLTSGTEARNVAVSGGSLTSSRGFFGGRCYRCRASGCTNAGFNAVMGIGCEATGCGSIAAFNACTAQGCIAHSNTTIGFFNGTATGCIAANNSGAATDGFVHSSSGALLLNCTAYNSGRHGFNVSSAAGHVNAYVNCLAVGSSGYGFAATLGADSGVYLHSCAGSSNGSGNVQVANIAPGNTFGFVALTGDPFVDAAGGNLGLNAAVGAGGSCRGAGTPGTFPALSTAGYPDIGAAQHQEAPPSGGGPGRVLGSGVIQARGVRP